MTNLVTILSLLIVTNWTGAVHERQEVGYVVTNHVATMVYDGRTNVVTLKSELGGLVTRLSVQTMTNLMPQWHYPTNWQVGTQWYNLNVGSGTNMGMPDRNMNPRNTATATSGYSYIGGGDGCIMTNVK